MSHLNKNVRLSCESVRGSAVPIPGTKRQTYGGCPNCLWTYLELLIQ